MITDFLAPIPRPVPLSLPTLILLLLLLPLAACAAHPTANRPGNPAALKAAAADVDTYMTHVSQATQKILTEARAADTALHDAPQSLIDKTAPHLQAIQVQAAQTRDDTAAKRTDFSQRFAKASADLIATIKQRDAAARQADSLKTKLNSELHRRLLTLIILLSLAGAAAIALGVYLLFTSPAAGLATAGGPVAVGLALLCLASLLGFYDRHQHAFEIAGLLGVAGVIAWLVISRIGLQQLQQDAAALLAAIESKASLFPAVIAAAETEFTTLKSRLFGPKQPSPTSPA